MITGGDNSITELLLKSNVNRKNINSIFPDIQELNCYLQNDIDYNVHDPLFIQFLNAGTKQDFKSIFVFESDDNNDINIIYYLDLSKEEIIRVLKLMAFL